MELSGVIPPITTPFQKGELSLEKLKDNFKKWNETGLSGYLVLGSSGENVYLTETEKLKIIETSRESIPQSKTMMVGTGRESTQESITFTNQATDLGADCALVITPAFFKGSMGPEVLYDHYIAVAEASQIGILVYNVPQFTGVNLEPELVARLSQHSNILGIKDSSGNIGQLSRIINLSRKEFMVFVGSDKVFFPALCIGAVGGILAAANVVPGKCTAIWNLFNKGKIDEARTLQARLTLLTQAMMSVYGIGGLKMAMDLAGYYGGEPRLPLKRPGKEAQEELKQLLRQL
ncbi:dihydrodipicolinate synthase family protein [Chloroflexota bacterium]